jgi:glycosyltransferase involved in cell wall biosynthesis
VAEGDTADMAVKMLALLDDEPLAKKMGEEGRRTVSENFTLEKHIDTITKAINAAISER